MKWGCWNDMDNDEDVNMDTNNDWSPLLPACSNGNHQAVKQIITYHPESINPISISYINSIHSAALYGYLKVLQQIYSSGGIFPTTSMYDVEPIAHASAKAGNLRILKWLRGVYTNGRTDPTTTRNVLECPDAQGVTTLMVSSWFGQLEIVKYLVEFDHCNMDQVDHN
ncbi:hypothetical protein HDU76_007646, partial [Blyttiomyces sp. JEL0837]